MLLAAALGGFVLVARQILVTRRMIAGAVQSVILAALLVAAGILAGRLPAQPGYMVAYGRQLLTYARFTQLLDVQEGRNSSLAITRYSGDALQISVAGHVEASNISYDMRLQRMIGHLPALLHPHPAKILGIGFGAGVSAGSFTVHPDVKSITICELEPKVPPTSSKYFAPYDNNVLHDPRTRMVYDDGRHFLRTTTEKFDIIASDPLDVWVKGTAGIYSADYFEEVKRHLNPGGYFTLYVPLYESDAATVKSEIATFFQAFPNGTIWANTADGQGYDLVLMGEAGPLSIDIDRAEARLARPDHARVRQSMREIGFGSASAMYGTFIAQKSDLAAWLKDAQINTDRNLRLMYLAGWGINSHLEDPLYRAIVSYRHAPTNIFHGSPEGLARLYGQMNSGAQGE
jgi:spermidine synthase